MTCKEDCIHSGLCYKENDYENFPERCGSFIRPQGEWISVRKSAMFSGMLAANCSRCGGEVDPMPCLKYVYCPMCGAEMRGEMQNEIDN